MRKLFLALGIVVILLSCDNGSVEKETNPFVGVWEEPDAPAWVTATEINFTTGFYFTATKVTHFVYSNQASKNAGFSDDRAWYEKDYSYDGTVLTIDTKTFPWDDVIIPYDFTDGYKFVFNGKEYTKVNKKVTFTYNH